MRSRAEGAPGTPAARAALEWALRVVALLSLAILLAHTFARTAGGPRTRVVAPAALLAARDSSLPGDTLRFDLASAPTPATRDFLSAHARAGRTLVWGDVGVPALAAAVEPPRAPDATPTLLVRAPRATDLALGDSAGTLDSLRTDSAGTLELPVPGSGRALHVRAGDTKSLAGRTEARASARESLAIRRVLVVGRAGWEAKFVVAALEEAGWQVDADLAVAPGVDVVQAEGAARAAGITPDTARHGAVVVLDSSAARPAARAAAVVRFVRAGGGVVLAGEGTLAFAALRAGGSGARVAGEAGALTAATPRRGLPLRPITPAADAVVLERRGSMVTAAARRVGPGRVVQLGYEDSWRWRMEGGDDAPEAHRRWWSAVVASVARAPVIARLDTAWAPGALDPAPLAATHAAIGAPSATKRPRETPARGPRVPDSLLLAAALLALLGEWASRRLRGAR